MAIIIILLCNLPTQVSVVPVFNTFPPVHPHVLSALHSKPVPPLGQLAAALQAENTIRK